MNLTLANGSLEHDFNFSIPVEETGDISKVGVYCSGGLDSTALLCLIMSELKATQKLGVIPLTVFTIVKGEGSTYYADRVVKKISEHFDFEINHVNNVENDPDAFSKGRLGVPAIIHTWAKNKNTSFFIGINQMAPPEIRPFDKTLKITYRENPTLYTAPFLNMHKPQILDLYYKLGCEDIIQYTHSCTVQAIGTCNNCYSCAERAWGFSALDQIDPGTVEPDVTDISFGSTWKLP
jgi:hypothetical protein